MIQPNWLENGLVLTVVAALAAAGLMWAELRVEQRPSRPIVITLSAAGDPDDDGDEDIVSASASATVPLYASLAELSPRAQQLLAESQPSPDLLHELARQARVFRAYELADALLARCLKLAPQRVDTLFLRARTQSDLGRPKQAVQMYEAVLAQSPNHQKATYNLGVLSRRGGDLARAEALLTRAAELSSGRLKSKALNQLGLTRGAAGHWDQAAQTLREAVGLRPDDARFWLDLGKAEQHLNRPEEARAAYEKALALNRRLADAHAALGLLHQEQGNRGKALSHLSRAVKLDSANPDYRKALAGLHLEAGDTPKAREGFAWLARNGGDDAERAYAEAMLALLNRDTERLLLQLKRASALKPGGYDAAVEQAAVILYEQKDYKTARALLDTLLARPAPSPTALLAAARAAVRLEQWTDAETLLRLSLQARPEASEAWFLLGRVLSERDDLTGAIEAYRASLTRNPEARNTRLNLAVLYARSGREREALTAYEQLLQEQPRYTPALVNRARLHERAGRVAEAQADLEAALRAAPEDTEIQQRLAQLLLRNGQTGRARALLADAVAESPADPDARLLLAEAELRAGRRAEALKELGRAAALAGEKSRLWKRIAQLYRDAGDTNAAVQAEARAARKTPIKSPQPPPSRDVP